MNHVERSFLKWPGNKFQLIPRITPYFSNSKLFVEPFAGSGVVHLNIPQEIPSIISDINPDLINAFNLLKSNPRDFISECKTLFSSDNNCENRYYQLRQDYNNSVNLFDRSVLFVYLNRHGYNGLVRYNDSGLYNVPFGRYGNVYFPEVEMYNVAKRSQNVEYVCSDYQNVLNSVKDTPGLGVYLDPPYLPLENSSSNFTNYFRGFGIKEHSMLAEYANDLRDLGAIVLISNHDSVLSRELYKQANIYELAVSRRISCKATKRISASELLAVFEKNINPTYHFEL